MIRKALIGLGMILVVCQLASGSLWTGTIAPSEASICGEYSDTLSIIALNIYNNGGDTVEVSASLILPEESGLSILTDKTVSLGEIAPLEKSSIEPEWVVACTDPVEHTTCMLITTTPTRQAWTRMFILFSQSTPTVTLLHPSQPTSQGAW